MTADKAQQQMDEVNGIHQEITLRKMLQGQVVSLESYKSLTSKTSLLDAAIASGNGNAILGVGTFSLFLIYLKVYIFKCQWICFFKKGFSQN